MSGATFVEPCADCSARLSEWSHFLGGSVFASRETLRQARELLTWAGKHTSGLDEDLRHDARDSLVRVRVARAVASRRQTAHAVTVVRDPAVPCVACRAPIAAGDIEPVSALEALDLIRLARVDVALLGEARRGLLPADVCAALEAVESLRPALRAALRPRWDEEGDPS